MISSGLGGTGLGGTGLESRVAGWVANATIDDAAAVRAVIEAYGDRLAAADVAGVVSQFTGNAAAMQPGLETVVGSKQLTATYDTALENMRLDFTFRSDDITVQGDLAAVRATARGRSRSALPARRNQRASGNCSFWNERGPAGRSRTTCTSRCRSSPEGAAPASSESATRTRVLSVVRWPSSGTTQRRPSGWSTCRTGAVQVDELPAVAGGPGAAAEEGAAADGTAPRPAGSILRAIP